MNNKVNPIMLFIISLICSLSVFSQDTERQGGKSVKNRVLKSEKMEEYLKFGLKKNKEVFNENSTRRKQKVVFNQINKEIQKANFILKTGVDYKSFTAELAYVIDLKKTAFNGIIKKKTAFQTVRNITVTSVMLKELLTRIDIQLEKIENNSNELTLIQNKIDSLTLSESIYVIPKDSTTQELYFTKFKEMSVATALINNKFKNAQDSISYLEVRGNDFKFDLQNDIIEIDNLRKDEFSNLFTTRDNFFDKNDNENSFLGTFISSLAKESIILTFFIANHGNTILLMILFVISIIVYLLFLKHNYKKSGLYQEIKLSKQIFVHPISTSLLISFTLFNFFFIFPPFAYTALIWLISVFALTFVNRESISRKEKQIWRIYVILILLGLFDNNILIHSTTEVYFILFLTLSTSLFSLFTLFTNKILLDKVFKWTLYIVIGFEILSFIFILIGNYNFGKLLMINGLITILMYYLLTNTYKLIIEIHNYSNFLRETEEEKKMDINKIEDIEGSSVATFVFFWAWLASIGKNSYFFQIILDPVIIFFSKSRSIGDINYTYLSVVIFFLVLILSVLLAKIVSFLATNTSTSSSTKTNKFGSWLLLIQISIFAIGITIAFASAGIPVDRLTIIISALGVGIGFGLQTLVNNLVSGLIIAFEKPVNLDDIIEVNGQTGKMKSIGIRSSVLGTFNGADLIIPNGDLLSQHLMNWTSGNDKKRVEIGAGVAYETDLDYLKEILLDTMDKHELILEFPTPIVWFTELNESSIDFVIKFWVRHFSQENDVKSDILIAINAVFKLNNIQIPFPQQDVYIKNASK